MSSPDGQHGRIEAERLNPPIEVRLAAASYANAFFFVTFICAFLSYLQYPAAAATLFVAGAVTLSLLAYLDRVVFDGSRLTLIGPVAVLRSWTLGSRRRLRLGSIQHIETHGVRTIRRGTKIYPSYKTAISGPDVRIVVGSASSGYRKLLAALLPRVPDDVLDNKSIEMRDYLAEPKDVLQRAAEERIPEADVLELSFTRSRDRSSNVPGTDKDSSDRADYLRRLGNELRLMGRLHQALESFRRALVLKPNDARLIFDFARCLHALAWLRRNKKLSSRSLAAMRLAERRALSDGDLLTRLGEAYFHIGDWKRAGGVFQKSIETHGETFLAARGMAEVALREGKLAHVVHQFSNANRLATTPALRRYTSAEAEYFARLNGDEEYMEMEVGRVNLLQSLENGRRTAGRIMLLGSIPLIMGLVLDDALITEIGWAVMLVSMIFWFGITAGMRFFSSRIPYDILVNDRS